MKKIIIIFLTAFSSILFSQNVNITASSGTLTGSYATLKTAFDSINSGFHKGVISLDIVGNTAESASAVINASGIGSSVYTSIMIAATGPRTIAGAIVGPLVDLNGADNVTIDGTMSGGTLTITNTSTSSSASTVRFINDASSNSLKNCSINGGGTFASSSVVFFSTGIVSGNDLNLITNCNISSTASNPTNGISSIGSGLSIDNSGNTISNNNISDYFSATLVSNGINLGIGNSAWTISTNKLFQTASRIYTTANTHTAINVVSGENYSITDNIIGFANSSGTGTTNLIGNSVALTGTFPSSYTTTGAATATRFIGVNCAFAFNGRVSNIQNNTIAGIALYTSSGAATTNGILCGINVTSGNVNIGTTTGNTIGSNTGLNSIYAATTTSGGAIVGIYVSSLNNIVIQNNIIGGINSMGTTPSLSGAITGINIANNSASYDVSGNIIGNTTTQNLRMGNLTTGANLSNIGTTFSLATGITLFNGILSTQTGMGSIGTPALPNIIRNVFQNSSNATASVRGITASGAANINSNQINNLATASTSAAVGNTLLAGMGIYLNGGGGASGTVITKNVIHTIALTNITTLGTHAAGIAVFSASTDITFNQIYNITNASTSTTAGAPATVSGIFYRQPSNIQNVNNNMISLGNSQATNTSFNGIWQQNSIVPYQLNCFNNTINIEGLVSSGAQPSFGVNRGSYGATQVLSFINLKNNIINNTRSGGTGKHYALGNNYLSAVSNLGWVSNNNVLNAAASNIGHWGSDRTFTDWKDNSLNDVNSISNIPITFLSSGNGDLHLNMGLTPTQIESAGVPIGIAMDFDMQNRPGPSGSVNGGAFAPDLGADEFDGVPLDGTAPSSAYTPLSFTCSTTDRILTVALSDNTGVPTSGVGLPVLYWKINIGGSFTAATGVHAGGNNYNFTFGNGVVLGDSVLYYIVTQDNAVTPNVGVYPFTGAAGFTSNPPAVTTPPTILEKYKITSSLGGTYTVGAGGAYSTITLAVDDYNKKCLTSAVIFELLDATYSASEVFPIIIQNHPDASAINTLTIRPSAGVSSSITGVSNNDAIFSIEGNYVIIDGSNNGTNSRNLTITNNSILFNTVLAIGSNGTVPRTNVTVKNNILKNAINTSYGVIIADILTYGSGYFNDLTLKNNDFKNVFNGILADAVYLIPGNGTGLQLTDNKMDNIGIDALKNVGINLFGIKNSLVDNNLIGNLESASAENDRGIAINNGCDNITITNNTINNFSCPAGAISPVGINISVAIDGTNFKVIGNTVKDFSSLGTANCLAISNTSSNTTIRNNTISNFTQTGGARVIAINSSGIKNINISKNTITNINVNVAAVNTSAATSGILFSSGFPTNNIVIDSNLINNMSATNATFGGNAGIITFNPCNITNNLLSNFTQNSTSSFWGIISVGNLNSSVSGNTISGVTNLSTSQATGLNVQGSSLNINIEKNKISNIKNTNASGGSAHGVLLQSSANGNANFLVSNNMISDIAATTGNVTAGSNGIGIDVISGDGYKIYHNSVNMNTGQTLATSLPAAFLVTAGVVAANAIDLKNNIFNHSQTLTTERYAIYSLAPSSVFSSIDFND